MRATRQVSLTGVPMMERRRRSARPRFGKNSAATIGSSRAKFISRAFASSTEAVTKCWTTSDTCSVR